MLSWLLATVPQHDQEVLEVHAPLLCYAILRRVLAISPGSGLSEGSFLRAVTLAELLLRLIPPTNFEPQTGDAYSENLSEAVYTSSVQVESLRPRIRVEIVPAILSTIFELSSHALQDRSRESRTIIKCLDMVSYAFEREILRSGSLPDGWIPLLLAALPKVSGDATKLMQSSFAVLDSISSLLLQIGKSGANFPMSDSIPVVLDSLFKYLRSDAAVHHVRAVELIWEYNQLAEIHTLENVVVQRMAETNRKAGYEAFGTLWRLTGAWMRGKNSRQTTQCYQAKCSSRRYARSWTL